MTFENKIVVGLEDIKAVTFECAACKSRLTVPPNKIRIPNRCPAPPCDQQWLPDLLEDVRAPASPYLRLCNALRQIRELENAVPFRILLELEDQS